MKRGSPASSSNVQLNEALLQTTLRGKKDGSTQIYLQFIVVKTVYTIKVQDYLRDKKEKNVYF